MGSLKNTGKYDDIMGLPHPVSQKRARMSNYDRAAQFSPFAALTGYDGVIQETGRLTDAKIELGEDEKVLLDRKLRYILAHISERPRATLTVFRPDERKLGGAYVQMTGRVVKIDSYRETLLLEDGGEVYIGSIYEIQCDMPQEDAL